MIPELFDWSIALAIAHTESLMTGIRQRVRKLDGRWITEPVSAPPVWEPEFRPYADGLAGAK